MLTKALVFLPTKLLKATLPSREQGVRQRRGNPARNWQQPV